MSCESALSSPDSLAAKARVPLLAMVPRLSMASCSLMPMPVSVTVRVRASLSKLMRTSSSGWSPYRAGSCSASKRSLSQASEALETSSRRKISGWEYRECVTRCSTCATSAWKLCFCLLLMDSDRSKGWMKRCGRAAMRARWGRAAPLQAHSGEGHTVPHRSMPMRAWAGVRSTSRLAHRSQALLPTPHGGRIILGRLHEPGASSGT